MKKRFKTKIVRDGSTCFIPVTFDPAPVFGKVRAPVRVTLNGYTYRSTIASSSTAKSAKSSRLRIWCVRSRRSRARGNVGSR